MFTGIVEETGIVKDIKSFGNGSEIEIVCKKVLSDTQIGDSIAINGVCETVTEISIHKGTFKAKVSQETLNVTTFKSLKLGSIVNLERALTPTSRIGGHIMTGHVDCRGKFLKLDNFGEFYDLWFEITPKEQSKYIVYKGSVAINGISLTVAQITDNKFKVAIIPYTYSNTSLQYLNIGDFVNIETDILGKYVEKMLSVRDNESGISMNMLEENGFV